MEYKELLQAMEQIFNHKLGELKEVVIGRLDAIESRLDAIESRLDVIESRLDVIESRMDQIESRMDQFETRMEQLEEHMMAMESRQSALGNKMDSQSLDIKVIERRRGREIRTLRDGQDTIIAVLGMKGLWPVVL